MAKAVEVKGNKVRLAAVGIGWITQGFLLPGVKHTGNTELVALVSGHEDKADEVAAKYDLKPEDVYTYEAYQTLLDSGKVDAVYLATPNFDHVELAVQTLNAGVHLLLEKPMAVSVEECRRIMAAAEASGTKLMVAYRLHFEPATLKAIEMVRAGEIGTVRFFNSSFSQEVSGQNHRAKHGFWAGPVPDMGPYPINAVRNLFGAEPLEVFAFGVCTDPEKYNFEDSVTVTMKFPAERVASFTLAYNGGNVDDYRIVGSRGSIMADPAYQVNKAIQLKKVTGEGKQEIFSPSATDHFGGELKYFSDCVIAGKDPEPDGEEGMLDVRVLAAIEESLLGGKPVSLEPYTRKRRPDTDQAVELRKPTEPELIDSHKPSEGQ